ncbi:MAG TPA: dolichyl-phosphate beta-glucosyltransferase [Candidatus Aquicultor sp.]|jgi:dolichyl-phosphate beta-glucosyltransferase
MVNSAAVLEQFRHWDDTAYISIIIPAYNEEARLERTLRHVHAYFASRPQRFEIIVVDDGSADGTPFLAKRLAKDLGNIDLVTYSPNHGKGYAVKRGVLASHGQFVLISDADLSTPIEETEKLLAMCQGGTDVAFGSRALPESQIDVPQSFARRTMGRMFNFMVRAIALPGISDTQCGFKCLRGDTARSLFANQETERFAFDVELLLRARNQGCKIREVPVRWLDSEASTVHPISDAHEMFVSLLRIHRRLRK